MLPAYNFNTDLVDASIVDPYDQTLTFHYPDSSWISTPTRPVPDYSQQLFPTPSELLSNISHVIDSRPYIPSPPPPRHSPPINNAVTKTESQRKARQRALAEEIGFNPTDPYVHPPLSLSSVRAPLSPVTPSRPTRKNATI